MSHAIVSTVSTLPAPQPRTASPGGDRAARFKALVNDHFDFIWRSLRGLGVPAASADDAAQQVFLVASQKIDAIALGSERSFLFGTALGVAANVRRAHARRRELSADDALVREADPAPDPEELASRKQRRRRLDEILEEMPDELRATFLMFELEGMTTPQIASVLDLPLGTVASRLRRARDEFHAIARRLQARASKGGDLR